MSERFDIRDLIYKHIPVTGEGITIHDIEVGELVHLRETMTLDNLKSMTCRPVKNKSLSEYRDMYQQQKDSERMFVAGIYNRKTGMLVGKISVFDYNTRNKSVEIGYYIIEKHRQKGYAKDALHTICSLLFGDLDINKVYAQTGEFNKGSRILLEKVGFSIDGILRQHHELKGVLYDDYIYSLLKSDWRD